MLWRMVMLKVRCPESACHFSQNSGLELWSAFSEMTLSCASACCKLRQVVMLKVRCNLSACPFSEISGLGIWLSFLER